jgi:hypothetical protein
MSDEKQAFSRRLAEAMRAKGYDPKPGVLLKKFNSRYKGRSVAFSTASKWLRGMALPEQDKLQVLADLFGVEPHLLRFGGKAKVVNYVAQERAPWPIIGVHERQVVEAFLALPPKRRQLVGELVAALGQGDEKP